MKIPWPKSTVRNSNAPKSRHVNSFETIEVEPPSEGTDIEEEPSKHQDDVTTLSQCQMIGCIDVDSWLKMKVSPKSVDKVVATLRSNITATLWQRKANVVTTLQSRNSTKYITTYFQLILWHYLQSYLYADNSQLKSVNTVPSWALASPTWWPCKPIQCRI